MAWMSEEAAATVLGVSFKTIRRRVGNGSIRAMRQGRQILVDIEIGRISGPKRPSQCANAANATPNTGPTNIATLDAHKSEPVGSRPSSRALPISPVASKALQPAVISSTSTSSSTSSSPRQMGFTPISTVELPRRQWAWLAIWLLLTLLLTTFAVSAWINHQSQSRMLEADSRYQQAVLEAQQAQEKHTKQISTANRRERELIDELSAANAKLDEDGQKLAEQQNSTLTLTENLDKAKADLAAALSERKAIADKLASAQAAAQLLRWQASLSNTFDRLAERIPRPRKSRHAASDRPRPIPLQPVDVNDFEWTGTTPANLPARSSNNAIVPTTPLAKAHASFESANADADTESDENSVYHRPLPHQPGSLSQEETRAALRAIIKSEQDDADEN